MKVGSYQITYCTNVHPGETLDDLHRILATEVESVKAIVAPDTAMGAGLRLGNTVVRQLTDAPEALARLARLCEEQEYEVFTANGFPYGDFAAEVIKSDVYKPAWHFEDRIRYTSELARVLAALPGPKERTISTVAGGFLPDTSDDATKTLVARNLKRTAEDFARIADETGVQIRLCLEPEPWTTLETTDDVLRFFDDFLPSGAPHVREHLGICYDCCHQAVHFEDPGTSIKRLVDADITIGKVQVSSALHLDDPADPRRREALLRFAEPRFLHQVVARRGDDLLRCLDLATLDQPTAEFLEADAWRCHFHVPIWWEGDGVLKTTKSDWEGVVSAIQDIGIKPHFEIETYTWHVLPDADRSDMESGDLTASVVAEYTALISALGYGNSR
jgi:sugar phosphate isomerase/epimerase